MRRMRRWALAVGLAAVVFAGWMWRLKASNSPPSLATRALDSIKKGDSATLVDMADPEELSTLGLSAEAVGATIRDLESAGVETRRFVQAARMRTPSDQAVWDVAYPGDPPEMNRGVLMFVDDQSRGWRLNVSGLLFGMAVSAKGDALEGRRFWIQLARKHGIKGVRAQDGSYVLFDSLPIERRRQLGDPALAAAGSAE